ncbi:sulfurtransferase TusA family protein [Wenzhouxiangella sp. XN79A]|uniref:sulfurtransferase TusA family protein n=1 Tax=Wenzhouxiangella sp. XN79A TaxID=2724193 RepID=UPI00144AF409|nr:sulfurtransferase TusA family protein [Wenzhouxiangella sp. XN79A]NKI36487.1 sulfurtransferase TusA family protein [Wenzhouxiangella sp. XN79A]
MDDSEVRGAGADDGRACDRRLDATGLICPEPVLRARACLARMAAGERLEILTDDPMAELDFQVFCDRTGHVLEASRQRGEVRVTRIRRRAGSGPAPD